MSHDQDDMPDLNDYRLRNVAKTSIKGGAATIIVGACVIVVGLVFAAMAVFGFGLFQQSTANFRGQTSAKNLTNGNGAYRIAAYDHFFDACAGVQTDERQVINTLRELGNTTDEGRKMQLEANRDAQMNSLAGDINQYNADARKAGTLGQFRASDLPYQIDPNIANNVTAQTKEISCTA